MSYRTFFETGLERDEGLAALRGEPTLPAGRMQRRPDAAGVLAAAEVQPAGTLPYIMSRVLIRDVMSPEASFSALSTIAGSSAR